jgi:hypothetical protein
LLAPVENPSATRLASPRITITRVERSAPTTPVTTANVVMIPSFAP